MDSRNGDGLQARVPNRLILPVVIFCVGRSGYRTLSQRGIYWRETFYSLEELRRGNVAWHVPDPVKNAGK